MIEEHEGGGASRSTDPAAGSSAGTDVSLREYIEARDWMRDRIDEERDRRYTEVALEREKALKIKEEADKAALGLAREIQTYKDEKANELREQINSERGQYLNRDEWINAHAALTEKLESAIKPLNEFMTSQLGRVEQKQETQTGRSRDIGLIISAVSLGFVIIIASFGYALSQRSTTPEPTPTTTTTVTTPAATP
jgi:vacuolar-type H+-ATPase subunit H